MKNELFQNSSPSGYLLINKEKYWTSFDVVAKLRNLSGIRKIGHAGTLDPFATGLLLVAVGRQATKNINQFIKMPKEYVATLHLGAKSDTFDNSGKIRISNVTPPNKEIVKEVLKKFIGQIEQTPPMYSAKKIKGQRLYKLARQGKTIDRKKVAINIFKLDILNYSWPLLDLVIECSSGTYIRSLGHDIGLALSCGAYVKTLERTKIGKLILKDSQSILEINNTNWSKKLFTC